MAATDAPGTRERKERERHCVRSVLVVGVIACIALVPVIARGDLVEPKGGQYAGIGDGDLRIGFKVAGDGRVGDFRGIYTAGTCDTLLFVPQREEPDAHGRFNVFRDVGATTYRVKGRFLTRTSARGKLITHEGGMSCPGDYEFGFFTRRFGGTGHADDDGAPRVGQYAGAGDGAYVWFDVNDFDDGTVTNARLAIARGPCDGFNIGLSDTDEVFSDHRFRLEGGAGPTALVLRGRFVDRSTVRGKAIVDTTHPACPGEYEFRLKAKRFRDPG